MKETKKTVNPFIISKRVPTLFNAKVRPVVSEAYDCLYLACGNLIHMYSVTTGILIHTLRHSQNGHKAKILSLHLQNNKLFSVCGQGIMA